MKIDPDASVNGSVETHGGAGMNGSYIKKIEGGLTIRAHFAAMAMQGLLAATDAGEVPWSCIAKDSVDMADALIAELSK